MTLFKPGTYQVEAKGQNGAFPMAVTFSEDRIEEIEIDTSSETKGISSPVFKRIPAQIIEGQTLNVDTISGATVSSVGVINGVADAIQLAGGDASEFRTRSKATVHSHTQQIHDIDVVVIGSGGAGLSAAIEAKEAGLNVVVFEQMAMLGGNTNRATGGMNASYTDYQRAQGIEDSPEQFYEDTFKGGHELNDPVLLRSLVDHSREAVEWINQLGGQLTDVNISGGMTQPRFHRRADGSAVGPVIMEVLTQRANALEIPIILETQITALHRDEQGQIEAVTAQPVGDKSYRVTTKAVIVATGGFGANSQMVVQYAPQLAGFDTTNHPGATGQAIEMIQAFGGAVTQMDQIQIHPTTFPGTGYLFTEGLRGDGAILINKKGQRFVNELLTRDVVAQSILAQPGGIAYMVFPAALPEKNKATRDYIEQGYAKEGATATALAHVLEVDAEALDQTIRQYAQDQAQGIDTQYDRASMKLAFQDGPYYALPVTPSVHHTMGGLKIDAQTHVLNEHGEIIPHVYAAGEVTGGIHGGNRIGGNAVLDIIVNGRIAGQTVAHELL